jgi:hypothetical protein
LLAGVSHLGAQDVLSPPPPEYSVDAPAALGPYDTDTEATAVDVLTAAPQMGLGALQWGLANLEPRFLYRLNYSEGIRANRETTTKTLIHELHPGIKIDIGKLWDINYSPVARFYMSDEFRDTLNHTVRFSGGTSYGDWTLGLRQTYSRTEDPSTETGAQTERQLFITGLSAGYAFNSKLSLQLGLSQRLRFIGSDEGDGNQGGNYTDSMSWSTMNWLNYQLLTRVGVGVGAGVTYTDVSEGSDMFSEQVMGRANWRVQEKLNLSVSGGLEIRQFLDSEASDSSSPLYTIAATYQVFEHTRLTLTGMGSVSASAFRDTITESTTMRIDLTQRLLGHLNLSLGGGFRNSSYSDTQQDLETTREDDGTFFDVRLSTGFLKRATASVFYRRSENESSGSGFGYSSNQMGLEVGYHF